MAGRVARSEPRVSVVIPCFNDGSTVQETVGSVAGDDCEVVVVDDGSHEETTIRALSELERRGIQVVRQANQGSSAARMAGVAKTSGRYVVPLDADDKLLPGALVALADYLDTHSEVHAAWGDILIRGDIEYVRRTAAMLDPWLVTFFNYQPGPGSMVRRGTLLELGGWSPPDPGLPNCYWDWNFWMAMAERRLAGRNIGLVTLEYRVRLGRVNDRCRSSHQRLYRALHTTHRSLFDARVTNRSRSSVPSLARAAISVIEATPGLSRRSRGRLAAAAVQLASGHGGALRPLQRWWASDREPVFKRLTRFRQAR